MTQGHDPATLAFYAAEAERYVIRPTGLHPALTAFLERLPKGARILELGCGGGRDAKAMIEAGFDVDPTDGVPEMAAQAALYLGRPVRVLRFDALDARLDYDAVIASAALLHVPRAALPDSLTRIHAALRPDGWHLASFKTGKPEGRDNHGRYYNQLTPECAEAAYANAGNWARFEVSHSYEQGYFNGPSHWLHITAQKA